jgi:hypothetical protein
MEEITYNIDAVKNIIFTRMVGKINLFNLLIHMNKIENDKKFKKGLNTLVDMSEAFININFDELSQLKSHFKEKEKIRGGCKWAVLHKDKTVFNFVSIILFEIELSKIKIKLFKSKQKALEWLSI